MSGPDAGPREACKVWLEARIAARRSLRWLGALAAAGLLAYVAMSVHGM